MNVKLIIAETGTLQNLCHAPYYPKQGVLIRTDSMIIDIANDSREGLRRMFDPRPNRPPFEEPNRMLRNLGLES